MNVGSFLTPNDWVQFLVVAYFGSEGIYLDRCIGRAYRDFNRVLAGVGNMENKADFDRGVREGLRTRIEELRDTHPTTVNQVSFDDWHRRTCMALRNAYQQTGFPICVGHSQKWVNMTFKYIYTMGESLIPGFGHIYPFCHVPIDNRVLQALPAPGAPNFPRPWSRVDNCDVYLDYQDWIRTRFAPAPPLDVGFRLWLPPAP